MLEIVIVALQSNTIGGADWWYYVIIELVISLDTVCICDGIPDTKLNMCSFIYSSVLDIST